LGWGVSALWRFKLCPLTSPACRPCPRPWNVRGTRICRPQTRQITALALPTASRFEAWRYPVQRVFRPSLSAEQGPTGQPPRTDEFVLGVSTANCRPVAATPLSPKPPGRTLAERGSASAAWTLRRQKVSGVAGHGPLRWFLFRPKSSLAHHAGSLSSVTHCRDLQIPR
jgi:hypothetical protein